MGAEMSRPSVRNQPSPLPATAVMAAATEAPSPTATAGQGSEGSSGGHRAVPMTPCPRPRINGRVAAPTGTAAHRQPRNPSRWHHRTQGAAPP